jgi:hypothetical protein
MNDDLHPSDTPSDELLAVNATVDGTATAADQAVVDASPELQRLVARMTQDRAELSDVEVPSEVRERAIAAALAVFDADMSVAPAVVAAAPAAANVIRLEGRQRHYRWLTAAAAAVVVLFVGAAAFIGPRGSDDDSASLEADSASKVADDSAGGAPASESISLAVTEAAEAAPVEAPAATEAPAAAADQTDIAAASEAPPQQAPEATIGVIGGPAEPATVRVDSDAQLLAYAANKAPLVVTPDGGFNCAPAGAVVLGEVVYAGVLAVVTRDDTSGAVTAFDSATCAVLVSVIP